MTIKQISFAKNYIEIHWEHHGAPYITMLYRHSDYSWHPDADTRKLSPRMLEELQRHVWLCLTAKPKEKPKRRKPADTWFADHS